MKNTNPAIDDVSNPRTINGHSVKIKDEEKFRL